MAVKQPGVVFDAVGTLIYPDPPVGEIYASIGARYGSGKTQPQITHDFQRVFRDIERADLIGDLSTDESREHDRWRRIVALVLDDTADPASCFEALFDHFARPSAWRLYPDAVTTLESLHAAGKIVAIASNFDARLYRICRGHPLLSRCHAVVVSSQVGYRKPHRAIFRAVEAQTGLRPDQLLHVGDDLHADYHGARIAGWQSILLVRDPRDPSPGVPTIRSLEELFTSGTIPS